MTYFLRDLPFGGPDFLSAAVKSRATPCGIPTLFAKLLLWAAARMVFACFGVFDGLMTSLL